MKANWFANRQTEVQWLDFLTPISYLNRETYELGKEYDFELAGLIYDARCTNEEKIEVTDQETPGAALCRLCRTPERLLNGNLPPESIHLAGLTGLCPGDKYMDDAEFYCVIDQVSEFALEGIRIFKSSQNSRMKIVKKSFARRDFWRSNIIPKWLCAESWRQYWRDAVGGRDF